ncbi:MAG: hypothetical protein Kow0037_08210 [Calditrichia bacterium]
MWPFLLSLIVWGLFFFGCSIREPLEPDSEPGMPEDSLLFRWERVGDSLQALVDVRSLLTGTDGQIWVGCQNGFWWSADSGATWVKQNFPANFAWQLKKGPRDEIFAATEQGVFFSLNSGKDWQSAGLNNELVISLAVHNNLILAGTAQGLFISRDGALTWEERRLPWLIISACFAEGGMDCLVGSYYQGLYSSADTGRSWSQRRLPIENVSVLSLASRPPQIILAGCAEGWLFISEDGGKSWDASPNYPVGPPINSIITTEGKNAAIWVGRQDGEIWMHTDGSQRWLKVSEGLTGGAVNALATLGNGILLAGTENGLYYTKIVGQ